MGAARSAQDKLPRPTGHGDSSVPHQLLVFLNCWHSSLELSAMLSYPSAATSKGEKSVRPLGDHSGQEGALTKLGVPGGIGGQLWVCWQAVIQGTAVRKGRSMRERKGGQKGRRTLVTCQLQSWWGRETLPHWKAAPCPTARRKKWVVE